MQLQQKLKMNQLLSFFLPLGISSTLVTISHVIINSTLARSVNPELIIASYAIAMSIFGVTERSAILLRNTCSAIVRDRLSFRSLSVVALFLIIGIIIIGLCISYTPLGKWLFLYILQVDPIMLKPILQNYQILMIVTIFSCIRCLYQGIIISNMRTKWLTIGMVLRLGVMYALATYFISSGHMSSARIGAYIFLAGMMVEALVSFIEGHSIVKKMPMFSNKGEYHTKKEIFGFYRPLMYSSFISVSIGPAINGILGKTTDMKLAIASFAIATSLTQLVISFFSYIHQIVLNFYRIDKKIVQRFTIIVSLIPCTLLGILSYTAAGPWLMQNLMGVQDELMIASLQTMRVFMLMAIIFPWLDYLNGLILLIGQTKVTVASQSANLTTTVVILITFVFIAPAWNGMIGALAQSLGLLAELIVLLLVLKNERRTATDKLK